ncbi:ATP-dependent DNA helicase [Parachitinimonas caeni]|uniref:ATP-dependent DNA helicase n=1 Tax=Parachitinimonas caeni TaxID=3031301 RepID=A0ABT7E1Q3_9NEIS|nr:ATP-dependent DNA helicase [Parachitinimonas caeni]MDK2126247.1 ATP-dependent DNA helicase [Parachitinimonas caeni]
MSIHDEVIAGVHRILGVNGLLVRDGLTHSEIQFQYALRVAEGFTRPENPDDARTRINLQEAQTGTGKTLGYLVPLLLCSALTGKRVMVSTHTRALQKQILDKDAALAQRWVAEVTGRALTVRRRVGRANYLSPFGCQQLLAELESATPPAKAEADCLERILAWLNATDKLGRPQNSGVLDDCLADLELDTLPAGISRGRITLNQDCPAAEQQHYLTDVALSKAADVVVVNHALLMMHAFRWAQILDDQQGDEARTARFIVADEADRLPDAAASIIGADLTLHQMMMLAQDVGKLYPGASNAVEAIQTLHDEVKAMRTPSTAVLALLEGDDNSQRLAQRVVQANNAAKAVASRISRLLTRGEAELGQHDKLARFVDMSNDLALFATAMQAHDNTAVVSWSPVRAYPALRIGRPNPGRLLSRLWRDRTDAMDDTLPSPDPLDAILFTSATLSVPGKPMPMAFDEFAQSVGVIRVPRKGESISIHRAQTDLYAQFEPARFGDLQFVLADPRVPNPSAGDGAETDRHESNPEWLDYCAHVVDQAWESGGRVLVLTLSHADTRALHERLQGRPVAEHLLWHHAGEPLHSLTANYINAERAVLLTPGGWEGLDLPGMVPNLVISRIPFTPPQNADAEILRTHLAALGYAPDKIKAALASKATNAARRKLAQGIGRAIRTKTDKATIWIADPRFPLPEIMEGSLDPILMDALPRHVQRMMLHCIPPRFRSSSFAEAKLCLRDNGLYRPD